MIYRVEISMGSLCKGITAKSHGEIYCSGIFSFTEAYYCIDWIFYLVEGNLRV